MKIVRYPVFPDRPGNPARVHLGTGVIEINNQAFNMLPPYAQEYVLEHEKGHFIQKTFSEKQADEYALKKLALKKPNSLMNFVKSVRMVAKKDHDRINTAVYNALKIASDKGSTEAKKMLDNYACADGGSSGETENRYAVLFILAVLIVVAVLLITKRK